jgi:D-3-phosphoglycerate dehydrogenase
LIGADEIAMMKPGVVIVNTARGSLIDEKALLDGVRLGQVGAVALDVFGEEPYKGPLAAEDHVILTPHVGSYAREARVMMERMAVEHLVRGLKVEQDCG